jgi:hypothetical protein
MESMLAIWKSPSNLEAFQTAYQNPCETPGRPHARQLERTSYRRRLAAHCRKIAERPAIEHAARRDSRQTGVSERSLRIHECELVVSVAVDRKQASRLLRSMRQLVVDILSGRIAVDLHGHMVHGRRREHAIPVGREPRSRIGHPAARMRQHMNEGIGNHAEQPVGLVVGRAESRVRSGEHELDPRQLVDRQVELPRSHDVRLDTDEHPQPAVERAIHRRDFPPLGRHRLDGHPARTSRTTRVDAGPIPGIFVRVPDESTRDDSGCSSRAMAAAARL